MKGIRRILFPTDFSALSKHAIPHIAGFAERGAREIHLLHAPKRKSEASLGKIEATAAVLKKQVPGELTLRTCQVPGIAPGPVIVQYAREHQIDLIILATASKKGLGRLLLGSVAEEVSRQAPCHVLVVREQATAAYKQILVPLDLSKVSQPLSGNGQNHCGCHRRRSASCPCGGRPGLIVVSNGTPLAFGGLP